MGTLYPYPRRVVHTLDERKCNSSRVERHLRHSENCSGVGCCTFEVTPDVSSVSGTVVTHRRETVRKGHSRFAPLTTGSDSASSAPNTEPRTLSARALLTRPKGKSL